MTIPQGPLEAKPSAAPHPSWRESLAVYRQPRVLIVLLLGFSSGLPLALSGSTLQVWMKESGVDLGTIGLLALIGTPYTLKILWALLVDAFRVESLPESEQAAGMASYVAAYRIGMLVSTAGTLFIVSGFEATGLVR